MKHEIIEPNADEVIVHAVIDMDARTQYVIVQSTKGALGGQHAERGATVTIATPDGRVLSAEEVTDTTVLPGFTGLPGESTVYRLSLDRNNVTLVGGGTYRLHLVLAGSGREVSGATTLPSYPAAPPVLPPTQSIRIVRDTIELSWQRVANAASYEVNISSQYTNFATFADTSITLYGGLRGSGGSYPFQQGYLHQVTVLAVDANYYNYYRRSSDEITGSGVVSRLVGATGVFGSIVRVSRRAIDVRCPAGFSC